MMDSAIPGKGRAATPKFVSQTIVYLLLIMAALIIFFPLLNILIVSLNVEKELVTNPLNIPQRFNLDNYIYAWEKSKFLLYFFNTVFVCICTVTCNVIFTSMASYAISRFNYRGIKLSYYYFIMGIFVPIQVIILPLFKTLKIIGLLNTLFGMALVYTATTMPLSILLFTGFFKTIPRELDESALVDGCRPLQCFWAIIFPLSRVIIASATVLICLEIWRDFFIPLVITISPLKKTLAVGLLNFMSDFAVEWTKFSAAMVIQVIPIIVIFLSLQKYFVKGEISGAIKG